MSKLCRVVLIPLFPDKTGEERVFMDLLVNEDGTASKKLPTFGFSGDGWPKPTPQPTIRPFVLYSDGRMDFGDDADDPWESDEDRFSQTDLFSRKRNIAVGEVICVSNSGQEDEYRVAHVVELENLNSGYQAVQDEEVDAEVGYTFRGWPKKSKLTLYDEAGRRVIREKSKDFDIADCVGLRHGALMPTVVHLGMFSTAKDLGRWNEDVIVLCEENIRYDLSHDGYSVKISLVKGLDLKSSEEVIWRLEVS